MGRGVVVGRWARRGRPEEGNQRRRTERDREGLKGQNGRGNEAEGEGGLACHQQSLACMHAMSVVSQSGGERDSSCLLSIFSLLPILLLTSLLLLSLCPLVIHIGKIWRC